MICRLNFTVWLSVRLVNWKVLFVMKVKNVRLD